MGTWSDPVEVRVKEAQDWNSVKITRLTKERSMGLGLNVPQRESLHQ